MGNQIVFLRKLQRGGTEHSFGIHVARMAGMPVSIGLARRTRFCATSSCSTATTRSCRAAASRSGAANPRRRPVKEAAESAGPAGRCSLSMFQLDDPVLTCRSRETRIKGLDINSLTPTSRALNKLDEIKKMTWHMMKCRFKCAARYSLSCAFSLSEAARCDRPTCFAGCMRNIEPRDAVRTTDVPGIQKQPSRPCRYAGKGGRAAGLRRSRAFSQRLCRGRQRRGRRPGNGR